MSTTREVAEEWRSVDEWKGYEVSNLGRLLLWESHIDNESRKVGHGTRLQGERVPHAKMTDAQVLEFRRRFANGEPFVSLLKESGVSWGAFHPAMHGKTWKHPNPVAAIREGKPQE